MSLYDDLGVETSDSKTEGWSKNFKLLQSQLQVKKAALTQAKVREAPPTPTTPHPTPESRSLHDGFRLRLGGCEFSLLFCLFIDYVVLNICAERGSE